MSKVDLKVVLLGQHDVGKTCLVERYLNGRFKDDVAATVGAAFGAKKVTVHTRQLTVGIWDTAGAERYESMSRIYYRSAKAAIVAYDVTRLDSFAKVRFWITELLANESDCAIYVVGTKGDLINEKKVRDSDVEEYASTVNAKVFITSAKTGENVENLFQTIAEDFAVQMESGDMAVPSYESLDLVDEGEELDPSPPAQSCAC